MGRQKAVIKARREARRVLRSDSRSHRQREEESVTSLVQMGGLDAMAWRAMCVTGHQLRPETMLRRTILTP